MRSSKSQNGFTSSVALIVVLIFFVIAGVIVFTLPHSESNTDLLVLGTVSNGYQNQEGFLTRVLRKVFGNRQGGGGQNVPTPTPAFIPSPSSTPGNGNASSSNPAVAVMAQYANSVNLHSGDYAIAIGNVQRSISALEAIKISGLNKLIAFNSIGDLNTNLSSVPGDVQYIAYDTEQGTTPQSELSSLASSVAQFSQIVHSAGKKMVWVPQHSFFDSAQSNGTLSSVLSSVDMVVYQSQKLLTTESNYTQDIQGRYHASKTASPNTVFYLQLWVGTNGSTDQQIINGFNGALGYFDVAGIGGGAQTDTTIIFSGLSWRK